VQFGKGIESLEAGPAAKSIIPEPRLEPDSATAILFKLLSPSEEAKIG